MFKILAASALVLADASVAFARPTTGSGSETSGLLEYYSSLMSPACYEKFYVEVRKQMQLHAESSGYSGSWSGSASSLGSAGPSGSGSPGSGISPSGAPISTCVDDPTFRDALGFECSDWEGYSCHSFLGYSSPDMATIRESCPAACGCSSSSYASGTGSSSGSSSGWRGRREEQESQAASGSGTSSQSGSSFSGSNNLDVIDWQEVWLGW